MRHGRASEPPPGGDDGARELTLEGRQGVEAVAKKLAENHPHIDRVASSPLLRARETAALVATALGLKLEPELCQALRPSVPVQVAAQALCSMHAKEVLLVGHEPHLSWLAALLTQRPSFPPFLKGQVALLDHGRPEWLIRPDSLQLEHIEWQ